MSGELAHGRRASLTLCEVADGLGERELEFLQPARYPDRPALVAEMPLDLAHDGGRGIRGELHAPIQVEPVGGLDQADGRDLREVVEPLAPVTEPPCEVLDEGKVKL